MFCHVKFHIVCFFFKAKRAKYYEYWNYKYNVLKTSSYTVLLFELWNNQDQPLSMQALVVTVVQLAKCCVPWVFCLGLRSWPLLIMVVTFASVCVCLFKIGGMTLSLVNPDSQKGSGLNVSFCTQVEVVGHVTSVITRTLMDFSLINIGGLAVRMSVFRLDTG